jgi:hypothetical protein
LRCSGGNGRWRDEEVEEGVTITGGEEQDSGDEQGEEDNDAPPTQEPLLTRPTLHH